MNTVQFKQVDTFTTSPHSGTPSGVVVDAKGLTEHQMKAIAREINATETAFMLPPTRPECQVKFMWYGQGNGYAAGGHSLIAGLHSLIEEKKLDVGSIGEHQLTVETSGGSAPVTIRRDERGLTFLVDVKPPAFERLSHYKVDLVKVLNIAISDFDPQFTVERTATLYVALRRLHTVFNLSPDYQAMGRFLKARSLDAICVFTMETVERSSFVHSRIFSPIHGIFEDPVTGLVQGELGAYLYRRGLLVFENKRCTLQAEQGDAMGRPGRVRIELDREEDDTVSIRIGGSAVTVLEGVMRVP